LVAFRSTCTRLLVCAVLASENRIIASGSDGSVADGDHCIDDGGYIVAGHCVRTVHAEANALLQCSTFVVPNNATTLYVTHFSCLQLTKQIIQAGITKVVYEHDYRNHELAVQLFTESNIEVEQIVVMSVSIQLTWYYM